MARTREVAGGGRAVEVEPERLTGWFTRFTARHGTLVAVDGTSSRLRFRAADGASAEIGVPFGGLPVAPPSVGADGSGADGSGADGSGAGDSAADASGADGSAGRLGSDGLDADDSGSGAADPRAVLDALHAHLAVPRRVGIVLVRLGGYSVGVAVDGVVQVSSTGARPMHGRNRKGGSSSGRFARRRDNQARVALAAAADAVARVLAPVADTLDAVVLGGDTAALDDLRADRRLAGLLARAELRVLDVPEPRRAVLDAAARRARTLEIVVRDPAR